MVRRIDETPVLGHPLRQIIDGEADDGLELCYYELLDPQTAAVLGSFVSRAEAERFVIARELRAAGLGRGRSSLRLAG